MRCLNVFLEKLAVVCCAMLAMLPSPAGAQVRDSLAAIYASATPNGQNFILDQGGWKAIFDKAGRPRTGFIYRELRPGIDGNFVARNESELSLVDSAGRPLTAFDGNFVQIDTVHRIYKVMSGLESYAIYNAAGVLEVRINPENSRPDYGLYRSHDNRRGFQGVIDSFNRTIVAPLYESVQISESGIVAMRRDTAFVFTPDGTLRFMSRADEARPINGGYTALRLYGQWAVKDTVGKLVTPYVHWAVEGISGGQFFEAGSSVVSLDGRVVMENRHNSIYPAPGGWYKLSYPNMDGDDIRDENLNLLFSGHSYSRAEFLGERFIQFFKDYSDTAPKVYDRKLKAYTPLQVERALGAGAYLVFLPATKERRIMKDDEYLPLPKFDRLDDVEYKPLYRISLNVEEEKPRADPYENPGPEAFIGLGAKLAKERYGLLDTNLRIIVPMGANRIEHLENGMFFAIHTRDSGGTLHASDGRVLIRVPGDVRPVVSRGLVCLRSETELILVGQDGKILFRGNELPEPLFPDAKAELRRDQVSLDYVWRSNSLPVLIMYDDSSGYSGVYDLRGRQLLPHQYYSVAQRVPGVFSLKRDDSVYFINTHGRLLYGGRGFFGRNYHLLEGYGVVMRDTTGKWGVIDSRGALQLPFEYDSLDVLPTQSAARTYVLSKAGKYAILENTGRVMYPLQRWKPKQLVAPGVILAEDMRHYAVSGDSLVPITMAAYRAGLKHHSYWNQDQFTVVSAGGTVASGIYNQRMQRLANHHAGFDYPQHGRLIAITDSSKKRIAMIDTAGEMILPWMDKPASLLVNDSTIIVLDENGYGTLQYRDGRKLRSTGISIDSMTKQRYIQRGYTWFHRNDGLHFRLRKRGYGFVDYTGRLKLDTRIDSLISRDNMLLVRRGGQWGIIERHSLRYVLAPEADSIVRPTGQSHFAIFSRGFEGLYDPRYKVLISPRYRQLIRPATLEYGFVVARSDSGFVVLDRMGRVLTPHLDSIGGEGSGIPTMIAHDRGEEVSLSIRDGGGIEIERGQNARIRRAGIGGSFASVVVLQAGEKQKLYSNKEFRTLLSPDYDVISREEDGGFVAWKYKSDKHLGIDSCIVINANGQVIRKLGAGYNPHFTDGYWTLRGNGRSPVLAPDGRELLGEGYRLSKLQKGNFFIVLKDGKAGTMNTSLQWITQPAFERITTEEYRSRAQYIGMLKQGETVKFALIDREGRQLTAPVYDYLRDDGEQIYFRRGGVKGFLKPDGKEVLKPWDRYVSEEKADPDPRRDYHIFPSQ